MMRRIASLSIGTLLCAGLSAAPSVVDFLPEGTPIVVGTRNLVECREGFQRTGWWSLYNDQQTQDFLRPLIEQVTEKLTGSETFDMEEL